jgi:multiple sugar transport system ATP-binding protein
MTLADRIVVFSAGRVEQVGEPLELYNHPANRFVAGFIGSPRMNFLTAEVLASSGEKAVLQLGGGSRITVAVDAAALEIGSPVTLGVRPESLKLSASGSNIVSGILQQTEHTGDATLFYADLDGSTESVIGRVPGSYMGVRGQAISIHIPDSACHVFDRNGSALPRVGSEII